MTRKQLSKIFIISAAILIVPIATWAAIEKNIHVAESETIADNFVSFADSIRIDGNVEGDVIAAGGTVTISGTVNGDALIAAGHVRITGAVLGSVRIVSGDVLIEGPVAKNATIAANTLRVAENGSVGWSMGYLAWSATLEGPVYGNLNGRSLGLTMASSVGNNAVVAVRGSDFKILSSAEIGGSLDYTSDTEVSIEDGQVSGLITHTPAESRETDLESWLTGGSTMARILSILSLILIGLLLVALVPKSVDKVVTKMQNNPFARIGWGIVVFLGVPLGVMVLCISLIGIPLGIITLLGYFVVIYLSRVYIGLMLGQWLVGLFWKGRKMTPLLPLIVGVTIFAMLTWLPYVGWLIFLAGIFWSLSSMIQVLFGDLRQLNRSASDKKS
ncbi:MAG: polymer-forming cytoskeletal protein [bacterium]|nr:polymer-forming cytoskeletal protein [bacterium]